ncbi:D-2-hydroxyacid dehydrogenase [Candidatus Reidiella endopervernicosa]|uniref:D-2-hydroxyacid dehydrogenase n=1 Tax=Candidatus Reidiella endopervernicosa TaxID=2738883 RepID=A0A6N0I138_9GAMM|nr:D-2-hydroxyacid dehydrogenase [Candidatus Reidiella endopervernicosa]
MEGAEVVVTNKVILDQSIIEAADSLRLIAIAATGTNNVDLEAAREKEVAVCNVTGYATPSVVEHVFALILSLSRHLNHYRSDLQAGAWQQSPHFTLLNHPVGELSGKRLGIVGYGELGQAVARCAEAFGMRVLLAARPGGDERPDRIPLEQLLPQIDILTLHCPLSPETTGLIDNKALSLMKPSALLINAARGGIVDEAALLNALQSGRLAGAGIDTLAIEPPDDESPLLSVNLPNLIVTPHIAWASREARQRLIDQVGLNIEAFIKGEKRNRIV